MDNTYRIAVLMSTYNGEKFIVQQIDSILNQENVQLDLYIRDDGSTDATMDMIKRYDTLDNVIIVKSNSNLGSGQSFMELLYYVAAMRKYDYYAFADQDDIWLSQKLNVAINQLKDYQQIPTLYGSNREIYENGKDKGLLFKNNLDNSLQRRISINEISGCTMVFNDALTRQIVSHDIPPADIIDYRLHDAWIVLVALLTGKVIYDSNSYILYRIHNDNTVGIKKLSLKERFNHLFLKGGRNTRRAKLRSKTARLLLEYYPNISKDHKTVLTTYANYQFSFKNKWDLMFNDDLIDATDENKIIFRIKVLLNFV